MCTTNLSVGRAEDDAHQAGLNAATGPLPFVNAGAVPHSVTALAVVLSQHL